LYRVEDRKKRDPYLRWSLPDRIFFACGACHILAYAFLERHAVPSCRAVWLKPDPGFDAGEWVFDYHGYSRREFSRSYAAQGGTMVAGMASQLG
jgi:hypothetical protein